MDDGVDDRLTESHQRHRPALDMAYRSDHRLPRHVLLDELDRFLNGSGQVGPDFHAVQESRPVPAGEAACLDPGVREAVAPVLAEEEIPADGRHVAVLVLRRDPESPERGGRELPHGRKQLGSSSEVERFRVRVRDGLLVKRAEVGEPAHLLDLRRVRAPVGRADTDKNAAVRAEPFQVVRAGRTRIDLRHQDMRLAPGQNLDVRYEPRADGVHHEVGQPLFDRQNLRYAAHPAGFVLDSNRDNAASRVGKRDERLQDAFVGGQVSLVFEGLALRPLQQFEQVHNSALYSEGSEAETLPSIVCTGSSRNGNWSAFGALQSPATKTTHPPGIY